MRALIKSREDIGFELSPGSLEDQSHRPIVWSGDP